MGRPLVVMAYRLITKAPQVPPEALRKLPAMPSLFLMDNSFFYGEYPIIGNLPLEDRELDFPVMYGVSISGLDRGRRKDLFQCGRLFRQLEGADALYQDFRNNGVSFTILHNRKVWEDCIAAGNNAPFWAWQQKRRTLWDLRNPAFRRELGAVCRQFGLSPEDLPIKA